MLPSVFVKADRVARSFKGGYFQSGTFQNFHIEPPGTQKEEFATAVAN